MRKNYCCFDPGIGRVVYEEMRTNESVIDEVVSGIMRTIAKHLPATNFALERLLALIRASCPKIAGRKPRAVRLVVNGLLAQYMRRHLACGLPDKRGPETRQDFAPQSSPFPEGPARGTPGE